MQDEKEMLAKLRQGSASALAWFFKTYSEQLFYCALGFVRDKAVAEDLVQEVFIRLWEGREKLKVEGAVEGYLHQSVANACRNYLRDLEVRRAHERRYCEEQAEYEPFDEERLERLRERLREFVERLPAMCRESFKLACVEGLAYKEVASRLRLSENTVKMHVKRAYKRLREDFKKEELAVLLLALDMWK